MMRYFKFVFLFLLLSQINFGQIIKSQKEAERIAKESAVEEKIVKQYFDEIDKCRAFLREQSFVRAETSCRLSVSLAEKLPKSRYMEKHSAYETLGIALIRQRKVEEAISLFNKSLEVAKPNLTDKNAETGGIYFLLGQANHLLGKLEIAQEFYNKAETTYRLAFIDIESDEIRLYYPQTIKNILEAHLILTEDAGLTKEVEKIKKRLSDLNTEFAKYLQK